jgi:heme-degrading monooxygenase HmoA
MSMDVVARHPKKTLSTEAENDVRRVKEIWSDCRARHGKDGPFLFGRFSIADAMFAPIVWRFRTYGVACDLDWYETMLALPAMKQWEKEAEAEVAARNGRKERPLAALPNPNSAQHCFAVIFSSQLKNADGYAEAADAMVERAKKQPGFLGIESARSTDGFGITVSYWDSLEAIKRWKDDAEHRIVQAKGRESFYARYDLRVCVVERGARFP